MTLSDERGEYCLAKIPICGAKVCYHCGRANADPATTSCAGCGARASNLEVDYFFFPFPLLNKGHAVNP